MAMRSPLIAISAVALLALLCIHQAQGFVDVKRSNSLQSTTSETSTASTASSSEPSSPSSASSAPASASSSSSSSPRSSSRKKTNLAELEKKWEREQPTIKEINSADIAKVTRLASQVEKINKAFAAQKYKASLTKTVDGKFAISVTLTAPPVEKKTAADQSKAPNTDWFREFTSTKKLKPDDRSFGKPGKSPSDSGKLSNKLEEVLKSIKAKMPDVNVETLSVGWGGETQDESMSMVELAESLKAQRNAAAPLQIVGGLSTGMLNQMDDHGRPVNVPTGGTIGGLFLSDDDHLHAVSNHHVWSQPKGRRSCQPAQNVFRTVTPIGAGAPIGAGCVPQKYRLAAGHNAPATEQHWHANGCCRPFGAKQVGEKTQTMDASITRINHPDDHYGFTGRCTIHTMGPVHGRSLYARYIPRFIAGVLGVSLEKYGARSHRTVADVWAVNGDTYDYEMRGRPGHVHRIPQFADDPARAQANAILFPGCYSPANENTYCLNNIIMPAIDLVRAITHAEGGAYTLNQAFAVVHQLWNHVDGGLVTYASEGGDSGSFWVNRSNGNNWVVALHYAGGWRERTYSILTRWRYPYITDHAGRRWYGLDKIALAISIKRVEERVNALLTAANAGFQVAVCDERARANAGINV